jgi:hypothetical protein
MTTNTTKTAKLCQAADGSTYFAFRLAPAAPAHKPSRPTNDSARQGVLFSGMKCAPGQLDLFATDGQDTTPVREINTLAAACKAAGF